MRLCKKCFKIWKASKAGKQARQLNGNTWRGMGGKWPSHLYQAGRGRFCPIHQEESDQRLKNTYQERSLHLAALGFLSYKAYLGSKLWKTIRTRVLDQFNYRCEYCSNEATQVHHSSYDMATLKGETLKHLHPVCNTCHEQGEYFTNKDKATPHQATIQMQRARTT
jgi:hypothetical protein